MTSASPVIELEADFPNFGSSAVKMDPYEWCKGVNGGGDKVLRPNLAEPALAIRLKKYGF